MTSGPEATTEPPDHAWRRAVAGMTITSFLSDLGHEAQSTLLPSFLAALGLPPVALGAVEGVADATSSVLKLGAGWVSDRLRRRKPFVVAGYAATGLASGFIALASGLGLVLAGKTFGWMGRGLRGPLRDAMLADVAPSGVRGRAFGAHRFGDTIGAVLGPAVVVGLLGTVSAATELASLRRWMAWTLVPGIAAALVFAAFVPERRKARAHGAPDRAPWHALRDLPQSFRRYLVGVGVFGAGDFAHTLMILAAAQLLTPRLGSVGAAQAAAAMYVVHNIAYALAAYPAGAMADRFGHQRTLALGYALGAGAPMAWIAFFAWHVTWVAVIGAVFVLAGVVNGIQDTLEASTTAALVPEGDRGLGYGVLGGVNGVGDLVSSLVVGALWTVYPTLGFGYAAALMSAGAVITTWNAFSSSSPHHGDQEER